VRYVNNTGAFVAMADAVLYNAVAWQVSGSTNYSAAAAGFIDTWFLNATTRMNPNVNFGQVVRGPGRNKGSEYGVLYSVFLSLHIFPAHAIRQRHTVHGKGRLGHPYFARRRKRLLDREPGCANGPVVPADDQMAPDEFARTISSKRHQVSRPCTFRFPDRADSRHQQPWDLLPLYA
jgi:hypothetical protein